MPSSVSLIRRAASPMTGIPGRSKSGGAVCGPVSMGGVGVAATIGVGVGTGVAVRVGNGVGVAVGAGVGGTVDAGTGVSVGSGVGVGVGTGVDVGAGGTVGVGVGVAVGPTPERATSLPLSPDSRGLSDALTASGVASGTGMVGGGPLEAAEWALG